MDDGVCKSFGVFFVSRECKINIKNFNMEVLVKNSIKKTRYF